LKLTFFRIADEQGLLLLDIKDLQAMVRYAGDNAAELRAAYGNISPATAGAIQRSLIALEDQGGAKFFGEPALDPGTFIRSIDGKGSSIFFLLINYSNLPNFTLLSSSGFFLSYMSSCQKWEILINRNWSFSLMRLISYLLMPQRYF
jgi:DNA helicase HerA-like ATPase